MSPLHQQLIQLTDVASSVLLSGPTDVAQVVSSSFSWSPHDVQVNPLLKRINDGRNKTNGWWRQLEATQRGIKLVRKNGTRVSHLT